MRFSPRSSLLSATVEIGYSGSATDAKMDDWDNSRQPFLKRFSAMSTEILGVMRFVGALKTQTCRGVVCPPGRIKQRTLRDCDGLDRVGVSRDL